MLHGKQRSSHSRHSFQFSNEKVRAALLKSLKRDVKAADLKFMMYLSACEKKLPLSPVSPCPPSFSTGNNTLDSQKKLLLINEAIPGVPLLIHYLKYPDKFNITDELFDTISWLLLVLREPAMTAMPPKKYETIINLVASSKNIKLPSVIFNIGFNKLSAYEVNWQRKSKNQWTRHGFYPCKIEDLHSLIYSDLVVIPSKNPKRNSIVLYTNLNYCLSIAPQSWAWGKSCIGINIKVIGIVEYVQHYGNVRKEVKFKRFRHGPGNRVLELKTYRIINPAYARIKYLLIYVYNPPIAPVQSKLMEIANHRPFLLYYLLGAALSTLCLVQALYKNFVGH